MSHDSCDTKTNFAAHCCEAVRLHFAHKYTRKRPGGRARQCLHWCWVCCQYNSNMAALWALTRWCWRARACAQRLLASMPHLEAAVRRCGGQYTGYLACLPAKGPPPQPQQQSKQSAAERVTEVRGVAGARWGVQVLPALTCHMSHGTCQG